MDKPVAITSQATLAYYEKNAASFWEATRDHDVTQNYQALLRALEGTAPFHILDFGCGPGRDLAWFRNAGHVPVGLDGCAAFVEMARSYSQCEVWQKDFLCLDLPPGHFDGIFANATLQHVPRARMPAVMKVLYESLKPRGVLFSSIPRGQDQEGWSGGRYSCFYAWETFQDLATGAGFLEEEHYYRPAGLPREQQPWLASVWRRG